MLTLLAQLFRRRIVLAAALMLLIVTLALGASVFSGFDRRPRRARSPEGPRHRALDGHRRVGRDLYSRVIHGARYSLSIAGLTTLGSVLMGTLLGLVAGFSAGWTGR
jgi:peptide/nickel transport system permease protein